ncbi:MAG: hypothetical protein KAS75_08740 [Planctomycetes bacterium]|nr:hypothetical protein [Planctomycetota bacterium]
MTRALYKTIMLIVGIVIITSIAGCEEESLSNTRKGRLVAVENMQLKEQLKQCEMEIEEQKKLHAKEIESQIALLEKCEDIKSALEKRTQKNIREQTTSILGPIMNKNTELIQENQKLKSYIVQLEKELEELKKSSP